MSENSKFEIRNKSEMRNNDNQKPYDLEDRTFNFAKASRRFVKALPRTIANIEDVKQLVRASGVDWGQLHRSQRSNWKKDFVMKVKICRREAKESGYWLRLLDTGEKLEVQRDNLVGEATELMKIFGAIIRESEE